MAGQLGGTGELERIIVQARDQRAPVEHRTEPARFGRGPVRGREPHGACGDAARERLDATIIDTRVREQQRHFQARQAVQPLAVGAPDHGPGDHEHVIREPAPIKVFQHREQVILHPGKERVGRPVEDLYRRDVRLEVSVRHKPLNGFGVGHQRYGLVRVPQAVGVPDAVRTTQRAPLDVVQRYPRLAVLHDFARSDRQRVHLLGR